MSNLKRIRFSLGQALCMLDLGLDKRLGVDLNRSMLLTEDDCRTILCHVPRVGRTAMSIRRKVASLLWSAERQQAASGVRE